MNTDRVTRRSFVETVGYTAGAGALLARPGDRSARPGANEKIRLGLIGAGSRGNQLLDSFLKQADVEIVAVADVDDQHAEETAERIKKEKGNAPQTAATIARCSTAKTWTASSSPRPTTGTPFPRSRPCSPGKTSTSKSRSPTTSPKARRCSARPARPTRSWLSAPSSARRRISRRPSRSSARASSARSFGFRPGTTRTSARSGWARSPTPRRPSSVDYDRWLGPAP